MYEFHSKYKIKSSKDFYMYRNEFEMWRVGCAFLLLIWAIRVNSITLGLSSVVVAWIAQEYA